MGVGTGLEAPADRGAGPYDGGGCRTVADRADGGHGQLQGGGEVLLVGRPIGHAVAAGGGRRARQHALARCEAQPRYRRREAVAEAAGAPGRLRQGQSVDCQADGVGLIRNRTTAELRLGGGKNSSHEVKYKLNAPIRMMRPAIDPNLSLLILTAPKECADRCGRCARGRADASPAAPNAERNRLSWAVEISWFATLRVRDRRRLRPQALGGVQPERARAAIRHTSPHSGASPSWRAYPVTFPPALLARFAKPPLPRDDIFRRAAHRLDGRPLLPPRRRRARGGRRGRRRVGARGSLSSGCRATRQRSRRPPFQGNPTPCIPLRESGC